MWKFLCYVYGHISFSVNATAMRPEWVHIWNQSDKLATNSSWRLEPQYTKEVQISENMMAQFLFYLDPEYLQIWKSILPSVTIWVNLLALVIRWVPRTVTTDDKYSFVEYFWAFFHHRAALLRRLMWQSASDYHYRVGTQLKSSYLMSTLHL